MGNPVEQTVWRGRESQLVNLPHLAASGLAIWALWVLFPYTHQALREAGLGDWLPTVAAGFRWAFYASLLWSLWRILAVACHGYELTNRRVRVRSGVLNRKREEVELFRILDFSLHRPLHYRPFGRGHLILSTADRSHPVLRLSGVADPEGLYDLIRDHVFSGRRRHGVRFGEVD